MSMKIYKSNTEGKNSLIEACLNYIQATTNDTNEFLNVMRVELGMTDEEIEEYGKGYYLDNEENA